MPVSGIVIKCRAGLANELASSVHRPGSVEVHTVVDESTVIAVIEAETVAEEVDLTKEIMAIDGVVTVQLAYHNFEDVVPN